MGKQYRIVIGAAVLAAGLLYAPALHADWSFVMLGDTRGDNNTSNGISPYLNTIAQKIALLKPQLVMVAGDLCNGNCLNTNSPLYPTDGNFSNAAAKAIYAGFFANWKTAMQPVFNYSTDSGTPIYTVRGNHENEDGETAPIAVLKQAYYEAFSAYVPGNGPNNGLADDQRGFSWSFTYSNVTFVAADQYFNYTNASPDQFSGYHSLDRAWVTRQFQQSTSPYKIFMAHEPIFQTVGNGPGELAVDAEAQHFFGTNAAALQVRADFWNALGTNGVQLYLTGHLHLETVASTTNDYGNTIIQLTAGNGGAPPQPFIDIPEQGVTTLYNNGNTFTNATFGFSLATVRDDFMTVHYYSLNTNDISWTVADYVTRIAFDSNQPLSGSAVGLGSRQQTILPRNVPPGTPGIAPSNVSQYVSSGYGAWDWGAGTNEGRKFLTPAEYTGATNMARLLSFFSMSDIHITDKESPAQIPYMGWSAAFGEPGPGGLNPNSYSPVMFDTTYHLDAAVRTINTLHRLTPFDFGMVLGDNCNASQYNELRWFIDVMDGQYITPSSGTNAGAGTIDYQMPFQAAGLDRSIPWFEAIGNHDQYWMGIGYPTPKIQQALVGGNVLNMSNGNPLDPGASEGTGMYVGTVDGTTPFGAVIKWGPTNLFDTPPTVAADARRHTLTADNSSPTNYINEFFDTTSFPQGHGFNRANTGSLAACYTFLPLTNMPIKMIVLDDTCKSNMTNQWPTFYGGGWVDAARLTWLTNELQKGQDADQLMIIATHIPISPQANLFNTNCLPLTQFYDTNVETSVLATLHNYPNLILLMAGHRHVNVVTPQPSPDPAHPEYGFWEVETPSLRDFPRQFRTWEILRNSDKSISIVTTGVDPVVQTNSPAWKAIGYGVGAGRIFGVSELTNTSSHTYNAELVKHLTTNMQAKIAGYGEPLGHYMSIALVGTGVEIGFLGQLQSKNALVEPSWNEVPGATNSPYTVSAPGGKKFYRAVEY